MIFRNKKKNKSYKISSEDTGTDVYFHAIGGKLKNQILEEFKSNFTRQGDYLKSGGKASNSLIFSLLALTPILGNSLKNRADKLFIATSDPSHLMKIGEGFGSAVIGANGKITSHAAFIPAGQTLIPVVGPLLAIQALGSAYMIDKLSKVENKIDQLTRAVDAKFQELVNRQEATFLGEIISSISRLSEIEAQFNIINEFSSDMIIRLSLVENSVNPLFERYRHLYLRNSYSKKNNTQQLKSKKTDGFLSASLSMLDLKIDILKLKLALQESPGYIEHGSSLLIEKVGKLRDYWLEIERTPDYLNSIISDLRSDLDSLSWLERNFKLFGKKEEAIENKKKVKELEDLNRPSEIVKNYENHKTFERIAREAEKTIANTNYALYMWEDETGTHSLYTNQLTNREEKLQFSDS